MLSVSLDNEVGQVMCIEGQSCCWKQKCKGLCRGAACNALHIVNQMPSSTSEGKLINSGANPIVSTKQGRLHITVAFLQAACAH